MKRHAPATARNRDPILSVLREVLPPRARVLEVASGSGEHAIWFTRHLPEVTWQPSDVDPAARASIEAHRAEENLPNLLAPVALDVTAPDWEKERVADAVVCINMIHISPWQATEGLFRGASSLLAPGGKVYLYGAYRFGGQFTAPSNAEFDASLRARDPRWGVRDLDDVTALADRRGFARDRVVPMPANNHSIVFVRQG
jgi:SAM-dependent methyltransferase